MAQVLLFLQQLGITMSLLILQIFYKESFQNIFANQSWHVQALGQIIK